MTIVGSRGILAVSSTESLMRFTALLFVAASSALAQATPFTATDMLEIQSIQVADLTADGRWLAATTSIRRDGFGVDFRRDGDQTYVRPSSSRLWVIDTKNGERRAVFADKRNVKAARWSPDGSRLAFLQFNGDAFDPVIWDRASGKLSVIKSPAGKYVAENSDLRWSGDGAKLIYSLRTTAWRKNAKDMFAHMTTGPISVQNSKEPFLSWDAIRRLGAIQAVVAYDIRSAQTAELLPEGKLSNYSVANDGSVATYSEDITKKTDYDVIFGTENQLMARRLDCSAQAADCAKPRTLMASLRQTQIQWAADGKRYAYSKEGRVYLATVGDTGAKQIAGLPANAKVDPADTSKESRDRREKERFSVSRYSPAGDALVLSNREGLWLYDIAGNSKALIVATDSNPATPRVQLSLWSDDGKALYFTSASRQKWERGILRYDRTAKKLTELAKDARTYSNLRLSKDGSTLVLNIGSGNRPNDVYVADPELRSPRLLVETNPQLKDKQLAKTELLTYLDADGHKQFGVVYLPSNYTPGKTYPTVLNPYEEFFDDTFDAQANMFTSAGYVIVKPSVDFDIGYPGEAWIKGVTAAANKLIENGVADSSRLGVHGTSYGGYATNLLVTQTNRFRAAINISGKVDIISFYTDSPRLGVRNTHAAEKSQDRLGATLWQQPQKYVQHSAIMFADRIKTPLMLMTGAQDSNVPADNTREMYYGLRRLDKEVIWVNYINGGHGAGNATIEDFLDMQKRMLEFYDAKLKRPGDKVATN
jgi:dipeptidyl aminopeptidase/acylaminoacyl peptidase